MSRFKMRTQIAVLSLWLLHAATAQAFPGMKQNQEPPPAATSDAPMDPVLAETAFREVSGKINTDPVEALPVLNNGRIKPLHSLAKESILFIAGTSSKWGLSSLQIYLGLPLSAAASDLEIINVRSPDLRESLGFSKKKRHFSLRELENSRLNALAEPIVQKERQNSKSLNQGEKDTLEAYNQMWFTKQVIFGDHIIRSLDLNPPIDASMSMASSPIHEASKQWLSTLAKNPQSGGEPFATQLKQQLKAQPIAAPFQRQLGLLELEVTYAKTRPFLLAAIALLVLGALIMVEKVRERLKPIGIIGLFMAPFLLQVWGFGTRVYITGFAPVTNMYGTMLWVSLGVGIFSILLFALYKNYVLTSLLWIGSALMLLLTESIPLVLSPDMDPIVAVLRSNYWLTIHVLTITISYAAFTIVMLIGNVALVRSILRLENHRFFEEYAKYGYRMIQLGVFLLTVGIILGGIWADYSWGRFWGWDPKETWALIADLGFLAILHARYVGWLDAFGLLAASPLAYLLVIMAWYGVNFVLASGLHSYGFSSGGALAVAVFVALQVILLVAAALPHVKARQRRMH